MFKKIARILWAGLKLNGLSEAGLMDQRLADELRWDCDEETSRDH